MARQMFGDRWVGIDTVSQRKPEILSQEFKIVCCITLLPLNFLNSLFYDALDSKN